MQRRLVPTLQRSNNVASPLLAGAGKLVFSSSFRRYSLLVNIDSGGTAVLSLDEVRQGRHHANLNSVRLQELAKRVLGNVAAKVAPDLNLLPVLDDDRLTLVVDVPERPLTHLVGVFDACNKVVLDRCCQGILGLKQQVSPVLVQQDRWFRGIPHSRELERQLPGLGPWPPADHWRLSPILGKSPSLNGSFRPVDA